MTGKTFDDLVLSYERVTYGCPDTYDLVFKDGTRWYIRYRHGRVRLARDDRDDPNAVSMSHGDDMGGIFESFLEMKRIFDQLAARHQDIVFPPGEEFQELVHAATAARDLLDEIWDGNGEVSGFGLLLRSNTLADLDRALKAFGVESRGW